MTTINDLLPLETLTHLLSFLTHHPSSLTRAERVCRLWRQVICDNIWSRAYQSHTGWPKLDNIPDSDKLLYKERFLWLSCAKGPATLSGPDWQNIVALSVKNHLLAAGGYILEWTRDEEGEAFAAQPRAVIIVYDWTHKNNRLQKNPVPTEEIGITYIYLTEESAVRSIQLIDENKLIANSVDGRVRLWDWPNSTCLVDFIPFGPPELLEAVEACSHIAYRNEILFSACDALSNQPIKMHYFLEKEQSILLEIDLDEVNASDDVFVTCMTFISSKNLLVCGKHCQSADETTHEYLIHIQPLVIEANQIKINSDQLPHILRGHATDITCFAFHEKDPLFASGDAEGVVNIWHLESWELRKTIRQREETVPVTHIAFYHSVIIISGEYNGEPKEHSFFEIWDVQSEKMLVELAGNDVPSMPIQIQEGLVFCPQLDPTYERGDENDPFYPNRISIINLEEHVYPHLQRLLPTTEPTDLLQRNPATKRPGEDLLLSPKDPKLT